MQILVEIEGHGAVWATLVQKYADGDVRVDYAGRQYVCKYLRKEVQL